MKRSRRACETIAWKGAQEFQRQGRGVSRVIGAADGIFEAGDVRKIRQFARRLECETNSAKSSPYSNSIGVRGRESRT